MKLDTLYKRTRTGAIQFWEIVWADSLDGYSYIMKASGKLGTDKPIPHNEHIREGKQGRTHVQQAEFQAQSDWRKKRDEGYKSLEDLKIEACTIGHLANGYYSYPGCGVMYMTLDWCLNHCLPKFNTDASGNVKPMLAQTANLDKVSFPCYIQPKLDGVRCLMVVDGKDVTFLSRSGKEYTTLGHIERDVVNYLARLPNLDNNFILDGELYSDLLSFQEITQAVKKQYPNSLKLKFRAYDIVNDKKQKARWVDTFALVRDIDSSNVVWVETSEAYSKEQVKEFHDAWVQKGYEGAMLRLFDGTYDQGQRSSSLLKVKVFDENEFIFIGWDKGQREEDLLAILATESGDRFKAKVQGSKVQKEKLVTEHKKVERKSLKVHMFTVKHFGYTDGGLPRFPIGKGFRDYE